MAARVLVGRFGAPHGVRGEIRVQSFTAEPAAIGTYGPLLAADGRRFVLKSVRPVKDAMLVARVDGVADRAAAEALRHVELFVERSALPPPDEDEFYITDLVGLEAVTEDGTPFGRVVDVPNYGGGDLVEVQTREGGETILLPFTRQTVPQVDIAARRIVVVPPDEVEADVPDEGVA